MVSVNLKSRGLKHMIWMIYVALFAFVLPYVFRVLLNFQIDLYCLIFLASSGIFLFYYRKLTSLKVVESIKSGWALGSILALFIGLGFVSLAFDGAVRAGTSLQISIPVLLWRGIAFGLAGGFMISTLPFIIVWRSLAGPDPGTLRKFAVALTAVAAVSIISLLNSLSLSNLEHRRIDSAFPGNIVAGLPTLLSGNPMAAPIAGAFLSVSEVMRDGSLRSSEPQRKVEVTVSPKSDGGAN